MEKWSGSVVMVLGRQREIQTFQSYWKKEEEEQVVVGEERKSKARQSKQTNPEKSGMMRAITGLKGERWMKLRTTVQLSGAIQTIQQKKAPLKREDSFLKRFSTRQIPEAQGETATRPARLQKDLSRCMAMGKAELSGTTSTLHRSQDIFRRFSHPIFSAAVTIFFSSSSQKKKASQDQAVSIREDVEEEKIRSRWWRSWFAAVVVVAAVSEF
ncbi:hypothetical protein Fcan01_27087 [Folsomia candida]|uniref:Uncharacterized protein n=1 Tax=Folsomia candida TaxID=158441 RepID=A0A226D1J8_FOLCA|nr:hypothetical protein Fcan01_27087 [Folsomia candida]